jgi:chromosome segregation ATPase
MNDEELDILIANAEYEPQQLKDYITNLQEDNTMYAQLKDEYEEEIKELQEENEGYKQEREKLFGTIHELQKSYEKLERTIKNDKK